MSSLGGEGAGGSRGVTHTADELRSRRTSLVNRVELSFWTPWRFPQSKESWGRCGSLQ